jgi:ATP-binding cassette subfamily B protein RaxB
MQLVSKTEGAYHLLWCFQYVLKKYSVSMALDDLERICRYWPESYQIAKQLFLTHGLYLNTERLFNPQLLHDEGFLIVEFNQFMFVVSKNNKGEFVQLLGKESDMVLSSLTQLDILSQKSCIQLMPTAINVKNPQLSVQIIRFVLRKMLDFPFLCLMLLSSLLFYEIFSLIEPILLNVVIEHMDFFGSPKELIFAIISIGSLLLFASLLGFVRQYLWMRVFGQFSIMLSNDVFKQFLSVPIQYSQTFAASDLFSRFYSNEQVFYRVLQQVIYGFMDVSFLLLHFILMCIYQSKLAWIDGLFLIGLSLMNVASSTYYFHGASKTMEKQSYFAEKLMEVLQNRICMKLLDLEKPLFNRLKLFKLDYWSSFMKNDWFQVKIDCWVILLKKINWLLILGCGVYWIMQQQLSLGAFVAYLTLKNQLFSRFESGLKRIMQWQYLRAPLQRISTIFSSSNKYEPGSMALKKLDYSDSFFKVQNLSILHQSIDFFMILKGKKYILKGDSGCGKTSMLKLLMGITPCEPGKIYFQGVDCIEDGWKRVQQSCVMVSSEQQLFKVSILENICLFEEDINWDLYEEVIKIVGLNDIEQLEKGQLSAGQKQRVLLARALYRKPECLILDEATCHLDERAEYQIIQNLLRLPLTIIMVNHRPNYDNDFDEVIVWDCLVSKV